MRAFILLTAFIGWAMLSPAQSCPPEWRKYTSVGYLYDLQGDHNTKGLPEAEFKNGLLDAARTNLAKMVEVRVKDSAVMDKRAVDGRSHITYTAITRFTTDVKLKLVDTRTFYNAETKEGFAIAFIDKAAACQYYRSEIERVLAKADNALSTAGSYVASGFKGRARAELDTVLPEFAKTEEPFFWLDFFNAPRTEVEELTERCHTREQAVKKMIAGLKHGTVIYLSCRAELFGSPYPSLQNELKGRLSSGEYSFTEEPLKADWVIRVEVTTREGNISEYDGMPLYSAYANARVSVDKRATSQRTYEDELSEKGVDTRGNKEAVRSACRKLCDRLGEILKEKTKE